jgi:large subunit ribosomal protein L10
MTLTKNEKKNLLDGLSDRISRSKAVVFTNYQGLKVQDLNTLRNQLKAKNIEYKIVKNTLAKKTLNEQKIKFDESILDQPAAVAFSYDDEVEPNKIIYQFSKQNDKLGILGAIVNKEFVGSDAVKSLAMLPSREQLYANVVGSISAPISGFVNVLSGNLRGLVSVLKQYHDQKNI